VGGSTGLAGRRADLRRLLAPGLVYVLASRGIDVLLVQAAAPGRGVWTGGEHGAFASADIWERMARTTAQLYGIYVVLVNRVGRGGRRHVCRRLTGGRSGRQRPQPRRRR
jgi:predicted amidohydrolase